jgi:hypothetical protein
LTDILGFVTADAKPDERDPAIGLCAGCVYARRIESARESVFFMCELSATDPNFPKYLRLPVIKCSGYVKKLEVKPIAPR